MSGYKLVPVEPTAEMVAALKARLTTTSRGGILNAGHALADAISAAPAVQGEPVAWSGWGCQYPGKMPRLYGDRRIAELNCDWENGDQVLHFTAAPQPAEQEPAPDACVSQSSDSSDQGALTSASERQAPDAAAPAAKFNLGDTVRKTKGSQWKGRVVGTYSTTLTPEGYAVESDTEKGSVQIYPVGALELVATHRTQEST